MKDKDIEAKIDDLAQMVARGFMEIKEDMATKEDLVHLRGDIDIMLDRHMVPGGPDLPENRFRTQKTGRDWEPSGHNASQSNFGRDYCGCPPDVGKGDHGDLVRAARFRGISGRAPGRRVSALIADARSVSALRRLRIPIGYAARWSLVLSWRTRAARCWRVSKLPGSLTGRRSPEG